MHYSDSARRQLLATWLLTFVIIVPIVIFHRLDQPWRGLLDAGVVVGLSWEITGIAACSVEAFRGGGDR